MQFIQLISFIDVCSTVFLRYLDSIDHLHVVDSKFVVDLNSPKSRNKLMQLFEQEIKNIHQFGKINIYINTCYVSKNWRNEKTITSPKYELTDLSLMVNVNKMESIFDNAWNMFVKRDLHTFQYTEIDSMDLKSIINHFIGANYITPYNPSYDLIQDGNKNLQQHSLNLQIPDYLYLEVEIGLRGKQLI